MRLPLRAAVALAASVASVGVLSLVLPPLILRKESLVDGHNRLEAQKATRLLAADLASGKDPGSLVSDYAAKNPTMDFEALSPSLEVLSSSRPGPDRYDLYGIARRLKGDAESDAESFLAEVPGGVGPRYVLARLRSPFYISFSRSAGVFIFNGLLIISTIALIVACVALAAFSIPFARRVSRLARSISAYVPGAPPIETRPGDEAVDIAAAFNAMASRLALAEDARRAEETERRREEEEWRSSIAGISHDLRTPLAAVVGYSESLVASAYADEGERNRYESVIHAKAVYMSNLLDGLLVLARLGSPGPEGEAKEADICELTRSVAIEYLNEAERVGMTVDAAIPEEPIVALFRADDVQRAIRNLLDNAIRYAPYGGKLEICLRPEEWFVRLEIRDFGPGIPAEERDRIFERHFRGTSANGSPGAGLGLGLAIARAAARRSGGDLVLESPADGGCRFVLSLPLPGGARANGGTHASWSHPILPLP